ncbi:MAG: hypothetical protein KBF43_05025 [Dermatophilaceae bacterium]|nr:hypothetical protein [Dermatophilaceae bacterium]MBP9917931.1 hypothetical protein [Dermatophilaceae bacterium]
MVEEGVRQMKRVVFYLFYDPQGIVDDYVTYKLTALRPFAEHIFVVSNSALTSEGREKLESVADTVWVRENRGFDVWAYKEAMAEFGSERLSEYDELILMNYTFFAPIFPFSETFEKMDSLSIDFWGMTAHKAVAEHPFAGMQGELPLHIQSHWIAVRKTLFTSIEFQAYWRDMPMITSYDQSVLEHEAKFTSHFARAGFQFAVAFPAEDYPSQHPIFDNAVLMLDDRCPLVKRRLFFHEPSYLDRHAILGKRVMAKVAAAGYPTDLIWSNVVRSSEPRTLYTNFSMLEVLPDEDTGWRPEPAPKLAVFAHIYYDDMVDEMMSYITRIPVPFDLIVTTSSEAKREVITKRLESYDIERVEVRVVAANRGRDMSALLVGCRDLLVSDQYDLALRVHSKKSVQDDYNAAALFKAHMFDNVLSSTGYVARILKLFSDEPTLGMAFPPVVNIGYPTLGHSWFTNRPLAEELAAQLGVNTVFDRSTPLAPYGSMFWFRPKALLKLTEWPWQWTDYPEEAAEYGDGSITHVQERLLAYVSLDAGYHVRGLINTDWAAINYAFLEYKLQRISSLLPHHTQDQVNYLTRVQSEGPPLLYLKQAVDRQFPTMGRLLRPVYRALRSGAGRAQQS